MSLYSSFGSIDILTYLNYYSSACYIYISFPSIANNIKQDCSNANGNTP